MNIRPLLEIMSNLSYHNCMKKYLSHFSAAEMWDIAYIEAVFGTKTEEKDPIDITVSEHNARFSNNGKKVHSCELALPTGAITSRNGKMVASPQLLFLELACELSIHRLILPGLQLCSHPPGIPSGAVTTKQKLNTFLAKTSGHRGHRKAVRTVKYTENGSASVMESIAYMILTLPHSLGGYGLTKEFYAFVQNKLYYAVAGKTAAELIAERVTLDHPTMGLTTWKDAPKGKIIEIISQTSMRQ